MTDPIAIGEIIVHDDGMGIVRKSGVDADGNTWTQDRVTWSETFPCDICGDEIEAGWTCLDGGDWVCPHHITFTAEAP